MYFKNLVISGGGLKGYYFLGALKYLYENNLLKIEKFLGVSIGGVLCYLLTIGYDINFIINLFCKININKYIPEIVIEKIFDEYYCFDCYKFNNLIKYLTEKKNFSPTITFKELYEKTNIELIFGSTNISQNIYEYISYKTYPNLQVLIGLQMSYALPLLFKPIVYNNNYYVDGAVINNYPIIYFKKELKDTIGITLKKKKKEINNIFDFIKNVISASNFHEFNKYIYNSVIINDDNINMLDFENISEKRENMIDIGYKQTEIFFNDRKNIINDFVKNIVLKIIDNISNGKTETQN